MIRHIALENWRAYRHLSLDVATGTTFLVAPNGIGKTSLLEAVRWALSGSEVDDRSSMIRHGRDEANATVILATPQGDLTVRRTLRTKRSRLSSSVEADLEGARIAPEELARVVASAWSADSRFVARTAFLTEDMRRDNDEPDLRSHLCHVYSLNDLQRALSEIEPALNQTSREIKASRAERSTTESDLDTALEARDRLATEVTAARAAVAQARSAHAEIAAQLERAKAANEQRKAALAWDTRQRNLLSEVAPVIDTPTPDLSIDAALSKSEFSLNAEAETVRARQAELRAQLDAVEKSLTSLHDAGARCPVCLRELDNDSRENAEVLHTRTLNEVREQLSEIDLHDIAERLEALRRLRRQAAALGDRPTASGTEDSTQLIEAETESLARLEAAAAKLREVELAESAARSRADAISAELAEATKLTRQYRTVALFEAAKSALDTTITSVLEMQLAPLASEVNRRWQTVFPDRPRLRLAPTGKMSRDVGGDGGELDFDAFSAGERMVAKLMMRVTTLMSTTTVPFCFIDEPLEHLDPRSRRLVGTTLAHLSAPGALEQIFVTTYEEPLARRLAELQPDRVRVQYLRAEPAR